MNTRLVGTVLLLVPGGMVMGCESVPPQNPPIESLTWKTYSNPATPFSIEYPDDYLTESDDEGMRFRYEGFAVVSLSYLTKERAKKRGLWGGQTPVGEITMAGREGKKYIYNHYDGPLYCRTVSFVVQHHDRYVALEFRTQGDELDPLQRRMLNSLLIE